MATGHRAFEGESAASVAAAILDREPEPVTTVQPETPPAFEHVVSACLAGRSGRSFFKGSRMLDTFARATCCMAGAA